MLIAPDHFRHFSWVGIDPGLSKCGISVFKMTDRQLDSIEAFTLVTDQLNIYSSYQEEQHTERHIRLNRLSLAYREVLFRVAPALVCCESPFYNPKMPSAFGSLTEIITVLRLETNQYNLIVPFILYSPQEVKKTFSRSGKVGKLVMREALEKDDILTDKLITPLYSLDEHGVDAIAVGYTLLLDQFNWRLNVFSN